MNQTQVPDKVLQWLHNSLIREYRNVDRTYSDVAHSLSQYPTLSPRTEVYTFENGESVLLLLLVGTVPVSFRNSTYNFPISLWIPNTYPKEPPMAYVVPSQDMTLRPGQHVSLEGRIFHPYLANWSRFCDKSTLLDLMGILQDIFAKEPPVMLAQQQNRTKFPTMAESQNYQNTPTSPAHQHASQRPQRQLNNAPTPPPKLTEASQSSSNQSEPMRHGPSSLNAPPLPPKPQSPVVRTQPVQEWYTQNGHAAAGPLQHRAQVESPRPYTQRPPSQQFYSPQQQQASLYVSRPPDNLQQSVSGYRPPHPQMQPSPPVNHQYAQASLQQRLPNQNQTPDQVGSRGAGFIPPPQPIPDLMSSSLDVFLPSQNSDVQPLSAPPIPPNPEKDALLQALSQTLRAQLDQEIQQNNAAFPSLQAQQVALQQAQANMQAETRQLEQLDALLTSNERILHDSIREADRIMETVGQRAVPAVDDVLIAPSVVGEQLYGLVADERSIADVMFVLTRALDKGSIGADVFVKQTRGLAREQFLKKALIRKIAKGMGLDVRNGRDGMMSPT